MRKLTPIAALALAPAARAHDVEAELAAGPVLGWGAEWWVLALLALSVLLYAAGLARLWPRARGARRRLAREAAWFGAGWAMLVVALASPLDGAGGYAFSAHMVQHEILMVVAAPLLVLGRPLALWLWAFAPRWRLRIGAATRGPAVRAAWGALTAPMNAWLLHFAALWMWHVPACFQAALADNAMHALQHTSFLSSALLFWWAVLGREGGAHGRGGAIVYLFTTMMHTGALGALFTMSGTIWYPLYGNRAQLFGLSPLEDQQLGGLIMWIPGGLAYLAAGLVLCARWLRQAPVARAVEVRP
ncbi:MAG: cytochrome c oxidase assembly protein [Massilia sp.]|nr:cytochrome c oxidase assembly protein [Massilia sp.]